ncbi:hypothetical protein [Emticicia sp. BO119]|uniref:hypothetical protein n=1 Tax=Emticicia sp. BO119 TaxID=2757768 RepID=UPI0015F07D31|nr:hypothetical protein [Emticicia sp. BO119]MBA4853213.1 hypothetical protein [Emticicia sp. BO119]
MKIIIILLQVLGAITIFPWFSMAGLSFIVLKPSKSLKKHLPILLLIAVFAYPLIMGSSYWWSWTNFFEGYPKRAIFFSCLPLIIFGIAYLLIANLTDFIEKIRTKK